MDVSTLGQFVRDQRKRIGLTQVDLADLAGVSDRFLRELEKGKTTAEVGKVITVLSLSLIHISEPTRPAA